MPGPDLYLGLGDDGRALMCPGFRTARCGNCSEITTCPKLGGPTA